ncbi:NLR family CARD domain-containing protein 3 [Fundulus heteroclitus]|uniref:NLR family CARD domain-containing protein 3 n=1 Tax=Fundulus heteroclitus TaxID=8078 RepID=UPI00165B424C|nr:NLR family CARD domain-containing protein 3 [Fundulus heteroclitus]
MLLKRPSLSALRVQLERADSFSSCYSIDSDDCEKLIRRERIRDATTDDIADSNAESSNELVLIQDPAEIKHPSLTLKFTFEALTETLKKLHKNELDMLSRKLWSHYPQHFSSYQSVDTVDIVDIVDRLVAAFGCESSVQITRTVLVSLNRSKIAEYLQSLCIENAVRYELRASLKKKFWEETITDGEKVPLDDIYTDLCVLSAIDNGPNIEHEVVTVEKLNTKKTPDKQIPLEDILSPEMVKEPFGELVYLVGLAGSGKSTFVRKLVLDWAMERSHHHLSFIFPLTFRELNQFSDATVSLEKMIWTVYPETERLKIDDLKCKDKTALFIFDGLDEYPGVLDFSKTEIYSDPCEAFSLHVTVVNLLRGRLLHRHLCMVTTRPRFYSYAPWDAYYEEIEMRGFRDADKDEYFRRRFKDPGQAAAVIEHVKSSKSLHVMCHLPLFCTLVADECQRAFREARAASAARLPRNLTYIYTKLLLTLVRQLRKNRAPDLGPEKEQAFLMDLGKLALTLLEKGQYRTLAADWVTELAMEAVDKSGVCMLYTITPYVLFDEEVMTFIHPTIQEYMAALYAYLSFKNQDKIVFEHSVNVKSLFKLSSKGHRMMELYKAAVDRCLQRQDGKMDMFLRFLFGMACKTNQELLSPFLRSSAKCEDMTKDCVALIKKIKEPQHPDRKSNLLRCLEELEV